MIIFKQKQYSWFSRGLRFFKELRTIEELPINQEEFGVLLMEPYLRYLGKPGNSKFEEIEDRLIDYYGSEDTPGLIAHLGNSFLLEWARKNRINSRVSEIWKNQRILKEGLPWTYEKILKLPKRYMFDSLGAGMYGICFDYPFGRIEKISYHGFTREENMFYRYLLENPNPLFPKIYTLEQDQVVMEKLITTDPKLNELRKYTRKYISAEIVGHDGINLHREPKWDKVKEDLKPKHWFYRLLEDTESSLQKIFGKKTIGDFHTSNFGIRPRTKELVYFDPIGGKILME